MNWIPITESQPRDGEVVLFVQTRDGEGSVECGQRYSGNPRSSWGVAYDMYDGESWDERHVTHWMPLPAPPPTVLSSPLPIPPSTESAE